MSMIHKGHQRKRLSTVQVQKLMRAIEKRISEDTSMSTEQFVSLTETAATLATTLHKIDVDHAASRKKQHKLDIFAKQTES